MALASYNICNSASFPRSAPYRVAVTHRCQRLGWVNAAIVALMLTGSWNMDGRNHGWTVPVERAKPGAVCPPCEIG
jgi:hypothetical protein